MSNFKKKKPFTKNSKEGLSPKLLKTLQNLMQRKSGSVSYVFLQDRVKNIHSSDPTKLEDVQIKSVTHCNLTAVSIEGKTEMELLEMFHSTKWDLGANYFIVD